MFRHHSVLRKHQQYWTTTFLRCHQRTPQQHVVASGGAYFSSTSSKSGNEPTGTTAQTITREDIRAEASYLTRSLYRTCLRSVKVIRWGNDHDDKEFERREEEFRNPKRTGGGILSMAPPPNRDDELRSRAEYYYSYTREYFTQESDCLDNDPLQERDIRRYLFYLRKGDKDRKWLLGDMMFPDPYSKTALDVERIKKFEIMSKTYLGTKDDDEEEEDEEIGSSSSTTSSSSEEGSTSGGGNNRNDGFIDDEDPEWFRKKYPHLR